MSFTGLTCFQAVCLGIYIRSDPQGAGFIQKLATIFQGLSRTFQGPHFQGAPTSRQVQKSDRINSDRQSGSDQLGSTRIE